MVGVTNALRHDIGGLMDRVFSEIKGVRVAVIAHGDYDSTKYSTLYMDFAQNDKPVKVGHGGSHGSFAEARQFRSIDHGFRFCLLKIGW